MYRFGVGLFFANASRLSSEAIALINLPEPPRWFILLADAIDDIDFTGAKTLVELARQVTGRGIVFCVAAPNNVVLGELDQFGLIEIIGRDHVFATLSEAMSDFHQS